MGLAFDFYAKETRGSASTILAPVDTPLPARPAMGRGIRVAAHSPTTHSALQPQLHRAAQTESAIWVVT
jgi:hypothetical protein